MRWLLVVALVAASACATARKEEALDELRRSVEAYNHAFRWKNYERASSFLQSSLRGPFLAAHEDDGKALHVEDYRILKVDLPSEDIALVTVRYRFTLLPSVTVQKRSVQQNWARVAGNWILESEKGSIRELDMGAVPQNPDAFGGEGEEEGQAEVEVIGPDGKKVAGDTVASPDETKEGAEETPSEETPPSK